MPILQATLPGAVFLALPLAAPPAPPPPPPAPLAASASPESADLAAEAPVPEWRFEGGGTTPATRDDAAAATLDDKIRRSARTSIAGGSIAILGVAGMIAGGVMVGINPRARIRKLEEDNGGPLPDDDPDKRRLEGVQKASLPVLYTGAGLFVVGAAMAVIAGRRLKKLRDTKRRSAVAFAPVPMWGGVAISAEVRF